MKTGGWKDTEVPFTLKKKTAFITSTNILHFSKRLRKTFSFKLQTTKLNHTKQIETHDCLQKKLSKSQMWILSQLVESFNSLILPRLSHFYGIKK